MAESRRIMLYSHDTYGLGHLRRSLLLAEELAAVPGTAVLIVTGSPRAQSFDLPRGCDTLKLPAVLKLESGGYRSRTLPLSIDECLALRGRLLRDAARAFRPHAILVDHAPAGVGGELRLLFASLESVPERPRMILGLRDIIDDVARVRAAWSRDGTWELIDSVYDRILVYGDPAVRTTAQELDLLDRYPGRVHHVGYLGRRLSATSPGRRRQPRIVVTVGGGGDGHQLLRAYVAFLERQEAPTGFRSLVLAGPFLSGRRFAEISRRLRRVAAPVTLHRFVKGAHRWISGAAGVICMAGYNTVVEVLAAGVPALFVPRETPRLEQTIRARRLAGRGGVQWCSPRDVGPERIAGFVDSVLGGGGAPRACDLRLDGVERAAEAVLELLPAETFHAHPV